MFSPRVIILLGRSGSGKGTQGEFLRQKLEPCLYVYTGDLFRQLARRNNVAGRKVKQVMDEGGLPPEWLAAFLWQSELLSNLRGGENIIFDGTPRRLDEAKEMDKTLEWLGWTDIRAVLIDITPEEALARLLRRKRSDDTEETIKNRLAWFESSVAPAIDYYRDTGRLVRVDGLGTVEEVFARIKKELNI
ncbi:MAG: nucleoside monophosphate kinase [Parcubacteria group bacterium]|nr:nucleoside monophosphate kinase [Parcubacteria group bacterium]